MVASDWDADRGFFRLVRVQAEIPISNELRFHTVFCCPVSKEESAPGNPPVLLKCGHAICKACVKRISFNMTRYAGCHACVDVLPGALPSVWLTDVWALVDCGGAARVKAIQVPNVSCRDDRKRDPRAVLLSRSAYCVRARAQASHACSIRRLRSLRSPH